MFLILREEWRAGLVEGAKKSIYPVLLYLFSNVDMLKQRAYLARYLIQVRHTLSKPPALISLAVYSSNV